MNGVKATALHRRLGDAGMAASIDPLALQANTMIMANGLPAVL